MIHCLIKLVKLFKIFFIIFVFSNYVNAEERLKVGITTSFYDSGLASYLRDNYNNNQDCSIDYIVKSTGQAIKIAEKGDIDLLIVHHEKIEEKFINDEYGIKKYKLMFNDFILVGPKIDRHKIKSLNNIKEILNKIFNTKSLFLSRGDLSGTHFKELELWHYAGIDINSPKQWYIVNGQGMGQTLNMSNALKAFTITDRATWLNFKNKEFLEIIFQNHEILFNQYSIILINPKKHNNINYKCSKDFSRWLLSSIGKKLINEYTIQGIKAFHFNGDIYLEK